MYSSDPESEDSSGESLVELLCDSGLEISSSWSWVGKEEEEEEEKKEEEDTRYCL